MGVRIKYSGDMLTAVRRLRDVLRNDDSEVPLDIAALELSTIEFPKLDLEASLFRLENLSEQVRAQGSEQLSGLDFIRALNELLFDVLQYRGNESDYYDPRNSCLNAVLSRRLGIPISLSVLYMEIARRLGRNVGGIGLPGPILVISAAEMSRNWIDPFHRGRILTFDDCCDLVRERANVDIRVNPGWFAPMTKRQILLRMLGNLKAIYLQGQAFAKARLVLDLLIEARPDQAEEYHHRGLVHLRQLNHRAAKADLEMYLRLEPNAPERHQVEQQLLLIEKWKATWN